MILSENSRFYTRFHTAAFTSCRRRAAWREPHMRGAGPPYGNDQALSYRAIFESFQNKDWFYGFYWWKWPTDLEDGGASHSGFTPNGKPAEEVVAEWYGRDKVE